MLQVHQERCAGREMSSPDNQITITKHILGLVDDTRQYTNDWIDNDLLHITNKLIDASQTWEQLLYTSGGKLEISKCVIFVLQMGLHTRRTTTKVIFTMKLIL